MKKNSTRKLSGKWQQMKGILFLFALMGIPGWVQAQVSLNYLFSQSSGTYTPLTGGTVVGVATSADPAASPESAPMDDFTYIGVALPFTFNYNGTPYTSININTNGWASFSTTASTSSGISGTTNAISPYGNDLMGIYATTGATTNASNIITGIPNTATCTVGAAVKGTGIPSGATITAFTASSITISSPATATATNVFITWTTGEIRTDVLGIAPNRTFVIQFKNMADYSASTSTTNNNNFSNFQIRLNEGGAIATAQSIDVVYGSFYRAGGTRDAQVGVNGTSSSDFSNRSGTTSWSATTAGTSSSAVITSSTTVLPASGLTFTWTPAACPAVASAVISGITSSAATATWSGTGTYILEYGPAGFTPGIDASNGAGGTLISPAVSPQVMTLSPGTTYNVYVRQNCTGTSSGYSINSSVASFTTAPANDNATEAIGLTVNPDLSCGATTNGTTISATQSADAAPGCSTTGINDDVWFSFVATGTAHRIAYSNVTTGTMVAALYTGTPGNLTPLSGACASTTLDATNLTPGTTYYVRAYTTGTVNTTPFTICVGTLPNMTYVSSTTTQAVTSSVASGASNQQIIGIEVVANGATNPLSLTQLNFNTTGSTNIAGIASAKVYYTGTSSSFATTTAFGSPVLTPNGAFSITGNQVLTGGTATNATNYFWLVYDVACTINAGVLDAQCTSVVVAGMPQTPTQTDPAGTRTITPLFVTTRTDANSTTAVTVGSINAAFVYANVAGSAPCTGTATQVDVAVTGAAGNIAQAKCYYTTTATFNTTTPFGSPAINPTTGSLSFTGTQALAAGANYFWVVYDVACAATVTNTLNADITGITINGNAIVPTGTTPAANAIIASTGYNTIADGDWSAPATWACGLIPATNATDITLNNNVTVTTTGNVAGSITIPTGKTLTINGGDLTSGPVGGGNKTFTNNGTLTVTGGTLNVNGNMIMASGSTFNQSAGNINIDGNSGIAGSSVASGTAMLLINSSLGTVSGGTITIVDPNFNASGKALDYSVGTSPMVWSPPHTLRIGDGISSQSSSNTSGFILEQYTSTGKLKLGNLRISGGNVVNRHTSLGAWSTYVGGNLVVDNGSEFRINSSSTNAVFSGDIVNDGIITATVALTLAGTSGNTTVANTIAQTISGSGIFRNLTTSPTANFTSIVINNTSASGVTFGNANTLLSGSNTGTVSGTLTMTAGLINTGSNALVLGTSGTATGTYTYTSGAIIGKFKRWLGASAGSRVFNLGSASGAKTATINFTTAPTAAGSLTAEWVTGNPGSNGLPLSEGSNTFSYVSGMGYWRISAGDGLSGGTYTATLNGAAVADVSDYTTLTIGKRANASANWSLDGTYVAPTGSNTSFTISRTGISSGFSEFGILSGSVPLPVTLESFDGKNAGPVNHLNWKTTEEKNFSHFELQRSADGITFNLLAKVNAGRNTTGNTYAYTDEHPLEGINMYRLNIVDLDGKTKLSGVVKLLLASRDDLTVSVYPNPVQQRLSVTLTGKADGKGQIEVLDITGKILQTIPVSSNTTAVELVNYPAGTYMIRYRDNSHNTVIKVNKN